MPRTSARESTQAAHTTQRQSHNDKAARARDRKQRATLKAAIQARLAHVPESWLGLYKEKLRREGLDPDANVQNVNNLDSLYKRKRLLPPARSYRHYTTANNPSRPEPRALSCLPMANHTKDEITQMCSNSRMIRDPTRFPQGSSIRRFAPKNVMRMRTEDADDGAVCVHPTHVQKMNRNGFQIHSDYQRDSDASEWPEVRVDVPVPEAGEVLQMRVPYHVAGQCGISLRPQQNRLHYN